MVGGDAFNCTPIWIAAAASANGAGGTIWATDLGLNNLGAQSLTYRFQFLPRGENNIGTTMTDPFTLGGNQAIAYSDIWNDIGGDQGSGSINVCVDNADTAGVISRTYNTGDQGTFGQTIVGMRGAAPAKVNTGEKVRLGYLFENDAFLAYASIVDNGTGDPSTIWPF